MIMSNTRRTRWRAAQVTAANVEQLLAELAATVAAEKDPATRKMMAEVWDVLDEQGRAEQFDQVVEKIRADAARKVITGRMTAELAAQGAAPGLIADMERAAMALGDDYWAGIAREFLTTGE